MGDDDAAFGQQIAAKASRKLKGQQAAAGNAWFGLGMLGVIGWSVAVPTVIGAFLGLWLDSHHRGVHSWTLTLLVAGLMLGCANAWFWVAKQGDAIERQAGGHDD